MSEQRLTVGVFRTVAEAQLVLERLAAEGVPASIATDGSSSPAELPEPPPDAPPLDAGTDGPAPPPQADASHTVQHAPTAAGSAATATPRVRIEVAEADFVRAMRVLFPLPDVPPGPAPPAPDAVPPAPQFVAPSNCTSCGRPVDPNAGVCWGCGAVQTLSPPLHAAPVDLVGALDWDVDFLPAAPPPRPPAPPPTPRPQPQESPPHPTSLRLEPAPTPLASPSAAPRGAGAARSDLTARAAEQAIRRAWWAALLGLVICPGIAHLYSLGVLLMLGFWNQPLSRRARWMYAGALVVDGLALVGVGWLLSLFF